VLRRFGGQPVSFERPQPDADTALLVDFTTGETKSPVVFPPGGEVEINGPRWVAC
jgi:hypothetical protein